MTVGRHSKVCHLVAAIASLACVLGAGVAAAEADDADDSDNENAAEGENAFVR